MIRSFFRFLGLVCLAAGFIFLIYDGTKSIADQSFNVTKLVQTWTDIDQKSLPVLKSAVEQRARWLWYPIIQTILEQPTWLVLGGLGIVLILLGRKKRPLIGYAR